MAGASQRFVNGKVFTGASEDEFVTSFEIVDGRFARVGDVDPGGAIDLGGRTVVPGFIDAHCHPTHVARIASAVPCTVPAVTSIPEMVAALRTHANIGKGPDAWIEGWGYDESKLAERRPPTRHELDRVSTDQPVFVVRSDFHSAACNSRALELAGVTRDTPDPEGARIGRDEDGEPNGVLIETAAKAIVQRAMGPRDRQVVVDGLAGLTGHYGERGIVAVTDMAVALDTLAIYRDAEAAGLRQQVGLFVEWGDIVEGSIGALPDGHREGRIRIAGVKLFADGTISGRTAWVRDPYPGTDDRGIAMLDEQTLRDAIAWARRNGVQVAVHAMGDAALQLAIDVAAGEAPWMGDGTPSVRLEHASLLTGEQMRQMRDAPMVFGIAPQIIFLYAEYDSYRENLDDARFGRCYPVRDYNNLVPVTALSSDAPATTWADPDNVFVSIMAAVTRKAYNGSDIGQAQAVTVPQAVRLHTARSAPLTPHEGRIGRIAEGYEGSFVVLDRDLFTIDPATIDQIQVTETWIAGERVFRA